jgi:hypothetical protein
MVSGVPVIAREVAKIGKGKKNSKRNRRSILFKEKTPLLTRGEIGGADGGDLYSSI